ncbi:penicillin acylase family protein [Streptomyces parvulus]|uniref:penicillin acylase family protein n=1 Tax=Streptomyces parvulus TaxID=146923 RepID=UPI0036B15AC3
MSAETYRDAWGIPHLRADSVQELARAQGRVTARDRAWQLEVERHRAEGTSASFLGPGALSWDRLARRARLADTARRCQAALEAKDPETAAWVRAYVDGVNEGLSEAERPATPATSTPTPATPTAATSTSQAAAPEFTRTGLTPGRWEPWTPLAVWLATHILFAGFPAKLWREHITSHLGPDAAGLFATDGPGTAGSNGWLVSGDRTTTGHALIAGDPHRWIEEPGVYQQIHLSCPEFDVVGLAVPGIPGIAHFGHTGTVAWAITNAMSDYQDLYHERLRRTGAGVEALGPDGTWHRAARHTELITVAGEKGTEGETVEVEVIETDRGPVIAGGPEGLDDGTPAALSLRYPPRVTADLGFGALLPLLRARRVADVDRALDAWAEPVNVVQAADTEGGLLHRVAGRVPVRAEANRLRPVPAWEPGHAWDGWHTPPRAGLTDGVAVMANQRGPATPLGIEFAPPHRADRITELLAGRERWSAGDMPAIHTDTRLGSAAALLDRIAPLTGLTPGAAALRDRLLAWDRHMDADSADAAHYAALRTAVVRRLAAHPVLAPASVPPAHPEVLQPWLALVPRVGHALEHLLRAEDLYGIDRAAVLRAALEEVAARPPAGTWGDTHRLAAWRALPDPTPAPDPTPTPAADPAPDPNSGLGPASAPAPGPRLSGDHDCVLCTSPVPGVTDLAARGPAARYVWDLADRSGSRWAVPHGASGIPGSPHHRDQQPLWLAGELAPVVTDFDQLTKESDV